MGKTLEQAIAVLNGAIGDHLARTRNGLATSLSLVHDGAPLEMTADALRRAYPDATARVAILVPGLMCTEDIWAFPDGGDYGAFLRRDLGYTPLYVRYNTGLAIADNGAAYDALLEQLARVYPQPLDEILLVGFSMGGLVTRSACHAGKLAGHGWLSRVKKAIYVGTPHRGAPLERLGRVATRLLAAIPDPYTRLIAELAELRSDGVKDLGDADVTHEHRSLRRSTLSLRDARHPVPLLPEIAHYLVAASLSLAPPLAELFGDVMVPLPSATDLQVERADYALPPSHIAILPGLHHLTLAHHPAVYAHVRRFCEEV